MRIYYRKLAGEQGWEASREQFILTRHIYVDETDQRARDIAEPALRYFFTLHNRGFNQAINPENSGLARVKESLYTGRSFSYFREGNRQRLDFSVLTWDELDKTGYIIAGNPDTVARKLNQQMTQVGANHFMGMFHIGNLSHEKVMASLDFFHKAVMPQLNA